MGSSFAREFACCASRRIYIVWFSSTPSFVLFKRKKSNQTITLLAGGRGWIRTTEVIDDRFTVCSLWPLGNPSTLSCKRCWLARFSVWRGLVRLCFRCPAAPFGFRFREAFVSSKDVFTENRPLWQALFCIFSIFFRQKIKSK